MMRAGKPHTARGRAAKRGRQERAIKRHETELANANENVKHPDPDIRRAAITTVAFWQSIIKNTQKNMARP